MKKNSITHYDFDLIFNLIDKEAQNLCEIHFAREGTQFNLFCDPGVLIDGVFVGNENISFAEYDEGPDEPKKITLISPHKTDKVELLLTIPFKNLSLMDAQRYYSLDEDFIEITNLIHWYPTDRPDTDAKLETKFSYTLKTNLAELGLPIIDLYPQQDKANDIPIVAFPNLSKKKVSQKCANLYFSYHKKIAPKLLTFLEESTIKTINLCQSFFNNPKKIEKKIIITPRKSGNEGWIYSPNKIILTSERVVSTCIQGKSQLPTMAEMIRHFINESITFEDLALQEAIITYLELKWTEDYFKKNLFCFHYFMESYFDLQAEGIKKFGLNTISKNPECYHTRLNTLAFYLWRTDEVNDKELPVQTIIKHLYTKYRGNVITNDLFLSEWKKTKLETVM